MKHLLLNKSCLKSSCFSITLPPPTNCKPHASGKYFIINLVMFLLSLLKKTTKKTNIHYMQIKKTYLIIQSEAICTFR